MIARRSICLASGLTLLVAHPISNAQSAATLRRVGMLSFTSLAASTRLRAAFTEGMGALGWRDGKNIEYRFVHAVGVVERL